jgi:hypothetical protein
MLYLIARLPRRLNSSKFISFISIYYLSLFLLALLIPVRNLIATWIIEVLRHSPNMTPLASESDVHYTVFVRLPFPRGDFIDPPPVSPFETSSGIDINMR